MVVANLIGWHNPMPPRTPFKGPPNVPSSAASDWRQGGAIIPREMGWQHFVPWPRTVTSVPAFAARRGEIIFDLNPPTERREMEALIWIEPQISYEGERPTVTGWRASVHGPYNGSAHPRLMFWDGESRSEVLAKARVYASALAEIPGGQWEQVEAEQARMEEAQSDDDSGEEAWWERFRPVGA